MRLLWVKPGGLWPLNTGGRLRSFHTISELSRRHRVAVLTTHGPHDDPAELAVQLPRCDVQSFPHRPPKQGSWRLAGALAGSWLSARPVDLWKWTVPRLRAEAARLVEQGRVDVCVADFLAAVPNLPRVSRVPVVLFEHNVEHVIWKRLAEVERRPWRRLLLGIESGKMRRYEARACARADLTVAVSEEDRALLARTAPEARVDAVPTGVDTSYFQPDGHHESPAGLVFTGSMDWYPNEDAILHFIDAVLPRVRAEVPAATLTVVGRNPAPRLQAAAARAGVRVTGTVEDVRPFVDAAAVYVAPLRVGGGTRLKIFEALAMGKAVVSTTVGAEGLPLRPGEQVVLADDPREFARAVVSLLRDPERRRAIGAAARRFVLERYSWARVSREFETCLTEVV
jgi:sugar transferase (PEP-CTERM/EpsH1 system associated)